MSVTALRSSVRAQISLPVSSHSCVCLRLLAWCLVLVLILELYFDPSLRMLVKSRSPYAAVFHCVQFRCVPPCSIVQLCPTALLYYTVFHFVPARSTIPVCSAVFHCVQL